MKKIITALLLMLAYHVNAHNSSKFTIELLNNLANQYQEVQIVSPDYAIVGKGEKFGAVDYNGKLILPIIYTKIEKFFDGMAVVIDGKYNYGYIDENFKLVIPCVYSDATEFCNGLAVVKIEKSTTKKKDYIDTEIDTDEGVCKFIDKKGQIDEVSSKMLSSFPQNNYDSRYGTYGEYGVFYCDDKIYFVESPGKVKSFHYKYDWPRLGKGYAIIHYDGKEGVVTNKGLVIPLKYDGIQEVGGYFGVKISNELTGSKCGLFDYDGKQIYPCNYDFVGYGFTVTHNGDEWKILDTQTNKTLNINEHDLDGVSLLNNNVIYLNSYDNISNRMMINKQGEILVKGVNVFYNHDNCIIAHGYDDNTYVINKEGKLIFVIKDKEMSPICDNFYMTHESLGGNMPRYGLLNAMGQEVLPCEYDEIRSEYGLFHLKKNGKITYFECIDVIDLLNKLNNNLNLGEQKVEKEDYKEGLAYYKKAKEILDILEENHHLLYPESPKILKEQVRELLNKEIERISELIKQ